MPEAPNFKLRTEWEPPTSVADCDLSYAELDVITNFSFLRGASHADELVYTAALHGYRAIAVTDRNTLSGMVRAHVAAKKCGLKLIVGVRLIFTDDTPDLLVWVPNQKAYAKLCRLLTLGKRRAEKGQCTLYLEDFLASCDELLAACVFPSTDWSRHLPAAAALRQKMGDRLSIAVSLQHSGDDITLLESYRQLSQQLNIPLLATNNVHYHDPGRRDLQDVLTCIREGCAIHDAGFELFANAERYLKAPLQMYELFGDCLTAIARGIEIINRCHFSMDQLAYRYPHEVVPRKYTPMQYLRRITWRGALRCYPQGVPEKVRHSLQQELKLIGELSYAPYFLTVRDMVAFARRRDILCQGRGSAANSAVCFVIGITSVNPNQIDLLIDRFISTDRDEPPDIDVDFEHERREEVIQYVYQKYGRDRCGITAEVITYRGRSAIRDVGKALGLSLDMVEVMAGKLDWWHRGTLSREMILESGLDPNDRTVQQVTALSNELLGFPRHLGQHVGGMVMSETPLCELVPIENAAMKDRTVIEWNKDDAEALGILKVDALALGMLTCIAKAFDLLEKHGCELPREATPPSPLYSGERDRGRGAFSQRLLNIEQTGFSKSPSPQPSPLEYKGRGRQVSRHYRKFKLRHFHPTDDDTYDMISDADTIGVFQVESRAQMSMLPRLKPKEFYDLVIEVAIVRPGPIQGNMVHPYLRRREGIEEVTYPSEGLRAVLKRTLGVPLFQEQAMKIAMVGAGFTGAEANDLRRSMAAWRKSDSLPKFYHRIVQGMIDRGYEKEFAERCFEQIQGFGEYGFPESHAASFALLVYVSAWLKRHQPAAFCAAILNSQPMGFYQPSQLVRDARDHGVEVRSIDVNHSEWDCLLEGEFNNQHLDDLVPFGETIAERQARNKSTKHLWGKDGPAVRLGFRQVRGLREAWIEKFVAERNARGAFDSVEQLFQRTRLPVTAMRLLSQADAFGSLNRSRRSALWETLEQSDQRAELIEGDQHATRPLKVGEQMMLLPPMPLMQEVRLDYQYTDLSLKKHPVEFIRPTLTAERMVTAKQLETLAANRWVKVAGLVLLRQRPGTASGIVFAMLEDETGTINLIIKPDTYDRYRPAARFATLLQCDGYLQKEGQIVHVIAKRLFDRSELIRGYGVSSRDFH